MQPINPNHGMGTLVNHFGEMRNPINAHVMPIYQSSAKDWYLQSLFSQMQLLELRYLKGKSPDIFTLAWIIPTWSTLLAKLPCWKVWTCCAQIPRRRPGRLWMG
jgi:hypothetical protein